MLYLDHAATTPLDPRVLEAMLPHMTETWGNPSSPHAKGREARAVMDRSRETIAELLGVEPHEVIFTASGSEGNTLAIFGTAWQYQRDHGKPGHIITLAIEHDCSLKAFDRLRQEGWRVTMLPVDENAMVDLGDIEAAITPDTALVSMQWANNEVGTIQPIAEIQKLCASGKIRFHCDAVQPVGILPMLSPVPDLMTIATHKFYGPKGIGVLTVRDDVKLMPVIQGGGQEFNLRAGTENVPAMVGMAKALEIATEEQPKTFNQLWELNRFFTDTITKEIDCASLNGHPTERIPTIANIHFEGHRADTLVIKLDQEGICVSAGAACSSGAMKPSHVLQAMGRGLISSNENIRFSFGRSTTKEDLETTVAALREMMH